MRRNNVVLIHLYVRNTLKRPRSDADEQPSTLVKKSRDASTTVSSSLHDTTVELTDSSSRSGHSGAGQPGAGSLKGHEGRGQDTRGQPEGRNVETSDDSPEVICRVTKAAASRRSDCAEMNVWSSSSRKRMSPAGECRDQVNRLAGDRQEERENRPRDDDKTKTEDRANVPLSQNENIFNDSGKIKIRASCTNIILRLK